MSVAEPGAAAWAGCAVSLSGFIPGSPGGAAVPGQGLDWIISRGLFMNSGNSLLTLALELWGA